MEIVPDLRFKALTKFAESTDTFLAKLRNMFYASVSSSYLQVERLVQLCLQVYGKVFEIVKDDEKLLGFVHRRILLYIITRVLPSVGGGRTEDLIQTGISRENLRNMLNFYQGLNEILAKFDQRFTDEMELVEERSAYLTKCLDDKIAGIK